MKKQPRFFLKMFALFTFLACLLCITNPDVVVSAKSYSALPFQGWLALDSYLDYAHTQENNSELVLDGSSVTLEAWVLERSEAYYPQLVIINEASYYLRILQTPPSLKFEVTVGLGGLGTFSQYVTSLETIDYTDWIHLAAVFDGDQDQMRLYVDGNLVATQGISPDDEIRYGEGWAQLGAGGVAYLDEVRISDSVRYIASFQPSQNPFVCDEHTRALWHFDEPEGSSMFHDACGYNNILLGINGAHTEGNHLIYLPITLGKE